MKSEVRSQKSEKERIVCFAVKEEAAPFRKIAAGKSGVSILITGVGQRNTKRAIRDALKNETTDLVLSCGFAGGLNPELKTGAIVFSAGDSGLASALEKLGARLVRFHCAEKIATTISEKEKLRRETGADAVEMESQVIETVCREQNIPCATVRVILDTAGEGLPLNFNSIMNARQEIDFGKLALTLVKSPGKIPSLIRLQKQSKVAATKLAQVLAKVIQL